MDPRIDLLTALLEQHRATLTSNYDSVAPALRDTRPNDAWSAANVIEHLVTTERNIASLISKVVADTELRDSQETFNHESFDAEIDMPFFLDRTTPIKGSQPSGTLSGSDAWKALAESRSDLLKTLADARGRKLENFSRVHPATGYPLNGYQWLAFIALHEARHAAQLTEIRDALK